eukprot:TCONS_00027689-protein
MELKEKLILKMESDPLFLLKRRLLVLAFAIRMFFIGVEYSVILPSCLLYMKTFDVSNVYMGLVVAAYPFAGMISLPIVGRIYDKTKRTRELFIVLNFLQITGNIIYAIPFSYYLPLSGRFLAGLGDGFLACAMGEITYAYPKSYRTGILSIMELGRVLGLVVGPAIAFFIGKKTYYVWRWRLDYATLPGVIMAFCWLLYEMLTLCFVFNVSKEMTEKASMVDEDDLTDNDERSISRMCSFEHTDPEAKSFYYKDSDETSKLVESEDKAVEIDEAENLDQNGSEDKRSIKSALKELFGIEFLLLFYVDCVLWLAQTEFEILLPFVTEFEYHWAPKWAGMVYMVGGVELIIIFVLLYYVCSKCAVRDSYMLILSCILTMGSTGLLIYEGVPKDINDRVIVFIFICLLVFTSIPFNLVASKAMLSKICRPESQGFIQGFYASVTRIALIMGPIMGSLVFHHRQVYGIVASVASFIAALGILLCVPKFNRREDAMAKELAEKGYD